MAKSTRKNTEISSENTDKLVDAFSKLEASLKKILEEQGDFNGTLRSAISDARKLDTSYEKIQARVASFSRETINVKKIEGELQKLKQKAFIEEKKHRALVAEYNEKDNGLTLDILEKSKKIAQQKIEQSKQAGKILNYEEQLLEELKAEGNLDAIKLYSLEKQRDLSKELVEIGKQDVINEKEAAKQLGISGNLVGVLAKKLGVGDDAYAAMVAKSKDLVDKNGKAVFSLAPMKAGLKSIVGSFTNSLSSASGMAKVLGGLGLIVGVVSIAFNKLGSVISNIGGTIKGLSSLSSNLATNLTSGFTIFGNSITGWIAKIPIVGGLLSGIVSFWASILDLVIGVEDYIVKTGRQIGLTAVQAVRLNTQFQIAAANSGKAYINSKALLDSQAELTKALGLNNIASQSNLETNIELSKFAGIELETRGKIYEASIVTKTSMKEITSSIVGQVAMLSRATGISFNYQAILREAASQSGRLGLMFAKYPVQLAKSLVSVKALGLELKQLESIGDTMLDFESSISKEFEAQLLLGRDINLNKAREAFLNNDLVTAASEITKHTGDANEFLKLNRIQQQSLADLMGMSVDSMADFLKKQEVYVKTGAKSREDLMKQVELSKTNTAEKARLIGLLKEEGYQSLINMSNQEKLMNSFEKIKQSLVDFLTRNNILEKIQSAVDKLTKPENLEGIVDKLKSLMSNIFKFVSTVTETILWGVDNLVDIFLIGDKQDKWDALMKGVKNDFSSLSKELSTSFTEGFKIPPPSIKSEDKNISAESETSKIIKASKGAPDYRMKDGVIFPGNGMVINKDPLDYTIFTKNPANLSAPSMDRESIKQIVSEAVSAVVRDRPIVVQTQANLSLDGQVAARSNYTNVKNNPLIGFDKTFGQMSLNT